MKILKLILFVATLQLVFAFGFQSSDTRIFYLKGKIEGIKDKVTLYLVQYSTGDTIAKSISRKGKFNFQGTVSKGTEYYFIRIDTTISKRRSTEFLLVNDKLSLTGDFAGWPKVILTNSEPHDEYLQLVKLWSATQGSDKQPDSIRAFINRHKNSLYIADLIRRIDKPFGLEEKDQMYQQLTLQAKESYFGELLKNELVLARKRESIKLGTLIPDFSVTLPDGQKKNALDIIIKSEYTLIDFWASWCKPCREAVPDMKKAYDAFHAKGFNILSIAVSDKDPDWRKAMEEDKTAWTNARDVEGVCNDIFDIPAIPGFVLVDKTGKLVSYQCSGSAIENFGPGLRGDTLYKSMQQLFDKKVQQGLSTIGLSPLKIGDKVPNISLGELASDPSVKKKISDYRGKLLILDFWSTWCTICIAQFPKIKKLQDDFKDKVAIVPVGFDGVAEGDIRKFLEKNKGTFREIGLPSVIQKPSDTTLMKLFPFSGLPHAVWIDSSGTLIGLTNHRAFTKQNIERILQGEKPTFSINKVLKMWLSPTDVFLLRNASAGIKVYGSSFCGYIDTFSCISSGNPQLINDVIRFYRINVPVQALYEEAYSKEIPELLTLWGHKRIIVEPSSKPFYKSFLETRNMDNWQYDDFTRNNLFSYELIMPNNYSTEMINKIMIEDFDRFFGVSSRIEKRNTKYLALVRKPGNKVGTPSAPENESMVSSLDRKETTIDEVIVELNYHLLSPLQIINETDIKDKLNIRIVTENLNVASLRNQLKRYNLDLIVKQKNLDMLILKDLRK